jgi:Fe2+ transport system protein FeoA
MDDQCRFCDIKPGQTCRLMDCSQCPERLREMGLVEGTEVEVVRVAPFGDTCAIRFRGCSACLRLSEFPAKVKRLP